MMFSTEFKLQRTCSECGGMMVIESLMQYGIARYITKSGKEYKRYRKRDYGSMDTTLFYCEKCGWSPFEDAVIE